MVPGSVPARQAILPAIMIENFSVSDGMVLVDPAYVGNDNRKVFATLLAAFRYGREDLDVLGLQFRKDLLSYSMQVYPPDPIACQTKDGQPRKLTRLQERLKKKLGDHAYPFWFEVMKNGTSTRDSVNERKTLMKTGGVLLFRYRLILPHPLRCNRRLGTLER